MKFHIFLRSVTVHNSGSNIKWYWYHCHFTSLYVCNIVTVIGIKSCEGGADLQWLNISTKFHEYWSVCLWFGRGTMHKELTNLICLYFSLGKECRLKNTVLQLVCAIELYFCLFTPNAKWISSEFCSIILLQLWFTLMCYYPLILIFILILCCVI